MAGKRASGRMAGGGMELQTPLPIPLPAIPLPSLKGARHAMAGPGGCFHGSRCTLLHPIAPSKMRHRMPFSCHASRRSQSQLSRGVPK